MESVFVVRKFIGTHDGIDYFYTGSMLKPGHGLFDRPHVAIWLRDRFTDSLAAIIPGGIIAQNLQAETLKNVVRLPGVLSKRREFFLNLLQNRLSLRNDFGDSFILPIEMIQKGFHENRKQAREDDTNGDKRR
jgi:hypothetical protein